MVNKVGVSAAWLIWSQSSVIGQRINSCVCAVDAAHCRTHAARARGTDEVSVQMRHNRTTFSCDVAQLYVCDLRLVTPRHNKQSTCVSVYTAAVLVVEVLFSVKDIVFASL